jgi:hypothetical protein
MTFLVSKIILNIVALTIFIKLFFFLLFHKLEISTTVVEGKLIPKTLLISDHVLEATT